MVVRTANFVLRLALGGVLILAGGLKVFDPGGFATNIANYRVLPNEFVNLIAITLPWVELTTGLFLVMGTWVRAAALLAGLMSLAFTLSVTQALARGLNIECGCFGTTAGTRIGMTHLVVDLAMVVVAAWLAWKAQEQ